MPKIGVMGPWIAQYQNINGAVSYRNGVKLAQMTQFEASASTQATSDDFYSDNKISETDRSGSRNGTITESVDDFSQEGSKLILGVKEEDIQLGVETYTHLVFDDDAAPEYFGHGIIIRKRKNGKNLHRAVVHRKVMFDIPNDAATTKGETIQWQAEEIRGTYMPDDSSKHAWKSEGTFESEEIAIAYIEKILNIAPIGRLTVTSSPGTAIGRTRITVTPEPHPGNSYRYIVAAQVSTPTFDTVIGAGYTAWNGEDEIIAATGNAILVVETDTESRAKSAGIATVTANDGQGAGE